ncbi:tRNA pseudouridine(38-40) synthase TruA [Janibacter melonis]|uniref:tRNA pseudouridine(38-40) synthase TruA n=1 Tax=Janibacter melonis TaxID=262209 RepID=UPI003557B720
MALPSSTRPADGEGPHHAVGPFVVRLRLDLAYDGGGFAGGAAQPGLRTVEGELTSALETICRTSGVRVVVAGRTDAGVHAAGQVCHVDLPPEALEAARGRRERSPQEALLARLRGVLPPDVALHAVTRAPEGFDARFSALQRRYRYLIGDDPGRRDPLRRHDVVALREPLDVAAMDEAATAMLGLRDFAAFCKRREGATTTRTLLEHSWRRTEDGLVEGRVVADAFCHSMVRALVGAVVPVGQGRQGTGWPLEVLTAGVRDPRVKVMPAHGLSLVEVSYPDDDRLAARAREARARRD